MGGGADLECSEAVPAVEAGIVSLLGGWPGHPDTRLARPVNLGHVPDLVHNTIGHHSGGREWLQPL